MKKSYPLCFARLLCIIVFSYFSCCSGLPTATFSCNRPSQSNNFVSNNAARVRAAQQMQARNQVHSLQKEWEIVGAVIPIPFNKKKVNAWQF